MARASMAKEGGASAGAALQLPSLLQTLAALQQQEQHWCTKVARVQGQVDKLAHRIDAVAERMREVSAPLIEQCRTLDEELHAAFARLLDSTSGLKGRGRAEVKRLYHELQLSAFLSDRIEQAEPSPFDGFPSFADFADGCPPPPGFEDAQSPSHKGRQKQASRDLFRKLAETLHPDKSHANETPTQRALREEAMKAASVAYQQGDLSRLMSIEKTWLSGRAVSIVNDISEAQARCEAIKARIADLAEQEKVLRRQLRHMRREPEHDLLRDIARFGEDEVFANVAEQLEGEANEMRRAVRLSKDFEAKRISLGDFLMSFPKDEDDAFSMDDVQAFFELYERAPARPPRKRKAR